MKAAIRTLAALVILFAGQQASWSASFDGEAMKKICAKDDEACTLYVRGFLDALASTSRFHTFCLPMDYSISEIRQEFEFNIIAALNLRKAPPVESLLQTLAFKFPCS